MSWILLKQKKKLNRIINLIGTDEILNRVQRSGIGAGIPEKIHRITTRPWTLMEICGGQTHSLVKNGILDMLPEKITMVHGPGCPVCVTSLSVIDEAIYLAEQSGVIFCSFGDMLRVPGIN